MNKLIEIEKKLQKSHYEERRHTESNARAQDTIGMAQEEEEQTQLQNDTCVPVSQILALKHLLQ